MLDPGAERLASAERRLAAARLAIVASGTIIYPFFIPKAGTVPWLAYLLLALAWVYGVLVWAAEPVRKAHLRASGLATTASDAVFTMLWLYATGGWASPFYVAIYLGVVAVAFRFSGLEAYAAAAVYAVAYSALLWVDPSPFFSWGEYLVRVTYVILAAVLGVQIAKAVEAETVARVQAQARLEAETERSRLIAAANEKLRELDAFKDGFLATVSHELRAPLGNVLGHASILKDDHSGAFGRQALEHLDAVISGSNRLHRLIEDLLDLARIRAGILRIDPREHDLGEVVDGTVAGARPAFEEAGILVDVIFDGDVARHPVVIDDLRVAQILENLLANARKVMPAGGTVTVRALVERGNLRVEVADTGPGIAGENIPRLFGRFEQLERASSSRSGGVGLGLAICKALVEAHGGTIGADSILGHGATFWFELPQPRLAGVGGPGDAGLQAGRGLLE